MRVSIDISTTQISEGESQEMKFRYTGELYRKTNSVYIKYVEYDDGSEIKNTIKLSDSGLSMIKRGSTESRMEFKQGEEYYCDYRSPQGSMKLYTKTDLLKISDNQSGKIRVDLEYILIIQGLFHGINKLIINIDALS